MIVEFSHNNFLHAQVERSIQYVLGLEPIELLQPSTTGTTDDSETKTETEQPTSSSHTLLAHVIYHIFSVQLLDRFFSLMYGIIFTVDDGDLSCPAYNGGVGAQRTTTVSGFLHLKYDNDQM